MMAHRHHIGARLIDFAVDDALAIEPLFDRLDDSRVEAELVDILRMHQFRRARARHQVTVGISRVAHGNVTEGVEHAFIGDHAVGAREQLTRFVELIWHGVSSQLPWLGLSWPFTSQVVRDLKGVDARHKAGHDAWEFIVASSPLAPARTYRRKSPVPQCSR